MPATKKTIDEKVRSQVEKSGFITFANFEKKFGSKPSELLSKKFLDKNDLRLTRNGEEKVLALRNKTATILAVIRQKESIQLSSVYELNDWNSHVTGSVFRQSARDKFGIEKNLKALRIKK